MSDTHMIRDNVHNQSHTALFQLLCELLELLLRANFGIEARVVSYVVTVQAAGTRHHKGRGVTVGNPQVLQVVQQSRCLGEGEKAVQLQTVGGTRNISWISLSSFWHSWHSLL